MAREKNAMKNAKHLSYLRVFTLINVIVGQKIIRINRSGGSVVKFFRGVVRRGATPDNCDRSHRLAPLI